MASMQVPVKWTRNKEQSIYRGVCSLDLSIFKDGNVITGTWGTVDFTGIAINFYEGTQTPVDPSNPNGPIMDDNTAVKFLQMDYVVLADGVGPRVTRTINKYVYFGVNQSFSQNMDISLIAANSYSVQVIDNAMKYYGPTATHGYYGEWNMNSTVALSYEITAETPTNLKQRGTKIYEDIYVDFTLLSSNAVEYEVVIDDVVTIATTTTGRSIRIPAGTIKDKSKRVKVNIKSKLLFNGVTYYSPVVSISLGGFEELVAVRPTNLRLVGTVKCIEEPMPFAWDINDIAEELKYYTFDFEVWQNGIMVYSVQTNKTAYAIPPNTLKTTDNITIRVRATKYVPV